MDSAYLKKNVLPALTEALTAMASQVPEDQVEFVGKYLLSYVDRQQIKSKKENEMTDVESKLSEYLKVEDVKSQKQAEVENEKTAVVSQYNKFLGSIDSISSKEDAMKSVVTFIESSMNIPSAYIAVKAAVGESEVLKYLAVGPNSAHVLGKKLPKPAAEESEEAPERQGVSFEAFKVPEVPEEEAPAEESEEGAPVVPKGPPPLENLIIQNTMRDKRVKFFGIPKLGAYVAVPAVYNSVDHDAASVFNAGDGAEVLPSFELVKKDNHFLIGMDTVGKYRLFSQDEISKVSELSKALVNLFVKLDEKAGEKQLEFLRSDKLKSLNDLTTEFAAKIAEQEAAALAEIANAAAAAAAATSGEGGEPPAGDAVDPAVAELLKAKNDTAAALNVWNENLGKSQLGVSLSALNQFALPLPTTALKLLYAIALLFNYDPTSLQDACGDVSWDIVRKIFVSSLASKIGAYNPAEKLKLAHKDNAVASIKAYLEANNIADAGAYPSFINVFSAALLPWLQKAIAAREAAIAHSNEVAKVSLEEL